MIPGMTLTGSIFQPIAWELWRRGRSAVIVDPFTLHGLSLTSLMKLALDPRGFTPSFYADLLCQVLTHLGVRCVDIWGQSIGAHVGLLATSKLDVRVRTIILSSPIGIPHEVGCIPTTLLRRMPASLQTRLGRLSLVCGSLLVPPTRSSYVCLRNLARNPTYPSGSLDLCIAELVSDHFAFISSVSMPLLSINREPITSGIIESLHPDRACLIMPTDDRLLGPPLRERDGLTPESYEKAWLDMLCPVTDTALIRVVGGHEALFRRPEAAMDVISRVYGPKPT